MAKMRVCYEEDTEGWLVPCRMVITFKAGHFKWDALRLPIPFNAPFERMMLEDFDDDVCSLNVTQAELTQNIEFPDRFFVHIPLLVARLERMKANGEIAPDFDYLQIQQFVIWMGDIAELMSFDVRPFYDWRQGS